jgi:DNA adenine methylase
MVEYHCERCGKKFNQKSHYTSHKNRKTPCENNMANITDLIEKKVNEKINEITITKKKIKVKKEKSSVDITGVKFEKPFIKWVGGKTQIISDIVSKFPCEIKNYHELFLGGGSVLFALLTLKREGRIKIYGKVYAYDLNKTLINVYKHIQNNNKDLHKNLAGIFNDYNDITGKTINRKPDTIEEAKTSKESYFYWIRKQFNQIDKNSVDASSMFIFLNKTCFRGVYREGPNGFNVPYGHYKKTPSYFTEAESDELSDLIKDVNFIHCSFKDSIKNVKKRDLVYLDPPYAPETKTSFVGYTLNGFCIETHKYLFNEILELNKKKIKFVLSNAKVDLVEEYFKDFKIDNIKARRAINSKNPEATTTEVIIYN